jgi:peptide/nickel transport system permease protein
MQTLRYIGARLVTFVLVILVGNTFVFVLPRLLPTDPVEAMLAKLTSQGQYMDPAQVESIRASLTDAFGLHGSILAQYGRFLSRVLLSGDFGPSMAMYPTPVATLIRAALPWTFGLLLTSTLIAWALGNLIGLLVGLFPDNAASRTMEAVAVCVYPIPYYILALILSIGFSYILPIFPLSFSVEGDAWTWQYAGSVIWNSILPGLSIVIVVFGWWMISMKALAQGIARESFVHYARLRGVSRRRVMFGYVARNAMLPQLTVLALQIGLIFNGSLVCEILFAYPGIGNLIYSAVIQSDYNLLMGTIGLSIVSVAVATLLIDLLYPLLDPRIRYR